MAALIALAGERELRVRVELDVFSGRPNPGWDLDSAAADQVISLIREAKPILAPQKPSNRGLGFRGFVVIIANANEKRHYNISGETIQSGGAQFRDVGRQIESVLLSTMPSAMRNEYSDLLPR